MASKALYIVFLVFAFLIALFGSMFIVEQTEQAIVLQFGEVIGKSVLGPGLHFKVPVIQDVVYFDSRVLGIETEPREVIAADQKRLVVDAYAKYRIVNPLRFLQSVRTEYNLRTRVASIIESSMRQEVGKVSLNCLLSDCRKQVASGIYDMTAKRAEDFGIKVLSVRLRRIDLPNKNTEAIFQRMQTEREKEAREIRAFGFEEEQKIKSEADRARKVLLSEANQKANTVRGEGEARALEIYNDTYKVDHDFFRFYQYMLLYKNTISGDNTTMVLSSDNDILKMMFDGK